MEFLDVKSYAVHFILRNLDALLSKRQLPLWSWFKKKMLRMFYYDQLIYVYPGLEEIVYNNGHPPCARDKVPQRYWYMLGGENYAAHLADIVAFLKKKEIPLISCGYFDESALAINRRADIDEIYNFYDFLARDHILLSEISLSGSDPHPNEKGHCLLAAYLYEVLSGFIK